MSQRPMKMQALIRVAIILGILILLNFVSIRLFERIDVTSNNMFTLSEASRNLVGQLDDRVTVNAYFTEDLPAPYNNNRRVLLDQLNEYKAYSKGNFQYEFFDPTGEKAEQEAQQQGIPPVQVNVMKDDKVQLQRAYMGMVILYEDKKEVIPVVENTATLEYEISSTIKRITQKSKKTIGFLTGHGEPPLSELGQAQQLLNKQYTTTTVDVSKGKSVPLDVAALVVMAPNERLAESEKFQIDQYVMRGGRVAFFLNKIDGNLQTRFGRQLDLNLDDLLMAYGLRINADLVRDVQCANVSIMQQQFGFQIQSQVPFPLIPVVSNVNPDNTIVKDLKGVIMFFVSSVDTVNTGGRGISGEILMRSTEKSGRMTGMFMFDPMQRYTEEEFATAFGEKNIPVAAVTGGQFKSLFTDRPVPQDTAVDALPFNGTPLTTSPATRVVLVGDGDFARDQYLGNRDNLTLLANTIDYLVDDAGLISIRSKDVAVAPLDPVDDDTKKIVKYLNISAPPLLVLGYGLLRWRVRRARRKAMA